MKVSFMISSLCALLFVAGCKGDPPVVMGGDDKGVDLKENMINANKTIVQAEETQIDEYVKRRGWKMERLSCGARVWEMEIGNGRIVEYEDSVHVIYDLEAINGKRIYSDVEESFMAGRRQDMIGLDEAVRHLHFGSRAKVILPSNLGYGIGGDGDRITRSAILVMDVRVKE